MILYKPDARVSKTLKVWVMCKR